MQMARGVKAGAWNVNRRQCCAAAYIVHKKHTLHKKTYFAQIAHQVAHKSNIAHTLPQTTQWIFYTHDIAHTADTLKWLNPPLHGKHRAHHPHPKRIKNAHLSPGHCMLLKAHCQAAAQWKQWWRGGDLHLFTLSHAHHRVRSSLCRCWQGPSS